MGKKQNVLDAKRRLSEALSKNTVSKISKKQQKPENPLKQKFKVRDHVEAKPPFSKKSKTSIKEQKGTFDVGSGTKQEKKATHDVQTNGKGGKKGQFAKKASTVHEDSSDSAAIGRELFRMLIAPITIEDFFANYYEKQPLLVSRNDPSYYEDWMTMRDVRSLVDSGSLEWSTEVLKCVHVTVKMYTPIPWWHRCHSTLRCHDDVTTRR
jgi:hypothetical protein